MLFWKLTTKETNTHFTIINITIRTSDTCLSNQSTCQSIVTIHYWRWHIIYIFLPLWKRKLACKRVSVSFVVAEDKKVNGHHSLREISSLSSVHFVWSIFGQRHLLQRESVIDLFLYFFHWFGWCINPGHLCPPGPNPCCFSVWPQKKQIQFWQ